MQKICSTILPPPKNLDSLNHRSLGITGVQGAGKSELAFRFATQLKEQFDAIFFLTADSES